jgi:hypothetical protein
MMDGREKTSRQLSAYLDGELTGAEARRVEKALAEDAALAEELRALRATRNLVRSLPRRRAPEDLPDRVLAQAERHSLVRGRGAAERARPLPWVRYVAAAALVLVAVGVAAVVTVAIRATRDGARRMAEGTPGGVEVAAAKKDEGRERDAGEAGGVRERDRKAGTGVYEDTGGGKLDEGTGMDNRTSAAVGEGSGRRGKGGLGGGGVTGKVLAKGGKARWDGTGADELGVAEQFAHATNLVLDVYDLPAARRDWETFFHRNGIQPVAAEAPGPATAPARQARGNFYAKQPSADGRTMSYVVLLEPRQEPEVKRQAAVVRMNQLAMADVSEDVLERLAARAKSLKAAATPGAAPLEDARRKTEAERMRQAPARLADRVGRKEEPSAAGEAAAAKIAAKEAAPPDRLPATEVAQAKDESPAERAEAATGGEAPPSQAAGEGDAAQAARPAAEQAPPRPAAEPRRTAAARETHPAERGGAPAQPPAVAGVAPTEAEARPDTRPSQQVLEQVEVAAEPSAAAEHAAKDKAGEGIAQAPGTAAGRGRRAGQEAAEEAVEAAQSGEAAPPGGPVTAQQQASVRRKPAAVEGKHLELARQVVEAQRSGRAQIGADLKPFVITLNLVPREQFAREAAAGELATPTTRPAAAAAKAAAAEREAKSAATRRASE